MNYKLPEPTKKGEEPKAPEPKAEKPQADVFFFEAWWEDSGVGR